MSIFIGVDSGTQSTKAVALDIDSGSVLTEARAPHVMVAGLPPGHMEQEPRTWVAALESVLEQLAERIDGRRIKGIGISGQQHGFVPLDASGEVIRPAKLWCDTSTTEECALLTSRLGGPKTALRCVGNHILPGYTAPKVLWLKRHEPQNYRRLRHVMLPHDYLNYHLTGAYSTEPGDASGTGYFNVRKRIWSSPAIKAIDPHLADWLPPVNRPRDPAGVLKPTLARRLGFGPEVVVSAGGGDNMMSAIGTGNVCPGVVSASFGTSGTIYAYASEPVVDPLGEIAAFCSSDGGWLPLLCTMNVTTVVEQIRTLFGLDQTAMDRLVGATPAGSAGLVMLPYLAGERTPNLPQGSGVFLGLTKQTLRAGPMARAVMEGVTMGMNYGLRRLARIGVAASEIRVTGGGARSPLWRQMMADIFGVPVVAMREEEGAALGAALQAAWCVAGMERESVTISDLTNRFVAVNGVTRCDPNPERVERYQRMQTLHENLMGAVRDLFDEQAALQWEQTR